MMPLLIVLTIVVLLVINADDCGAAVHSADDCGAAVHSADDRGAVGH